MTPNVSDLFSEVVGAVGRPEFPAVVAQCLARGFGFDAATIFAHARDQQRPSRLVFENFGERSIRGGLDLYCAVTHRMNPMLALRSTLVARAQDYTIVAPRQKDVTAWLTPDPEEELGFRTHGWPRGMEEVGLYLENDESIVELSLYRSRSAISISDGAVRKLKWLAKPIEAAFRRQAALVPTISRLDQLAPREREIVGLLREGFSTEAISLRLGLSINTVKDYRKRIYAKLGISSLAELFSLPPLPMGG